MSGGPDIYDNTPVMPAILQMNTHHGHELYPGGEYYLNKPYRE